MDGQQSALHQVDGLVVYPAVGLPVVPVVPRVVRAVVAVRVVDEHTSVHLLVARLRKIFGV